MQERDGGPRGKRSWGHCLQGRSSCWVILREEQASSALGAVLRWGNLGTGRLGNLWEVGGRNEVGLGKLLIKKLQLLKRDC